MYLEKIKTEDIKPIKAGSIFATYEWLRLYDPSKLTTVGIFDENKKLKGYFFHYTQKQMKVISHITTPPFTPHNGLTIHDATQNKASKLSFRKKLMTLIAEYYTTNKAGIITLAFPEHFTDMQPFTWNKFKVVPFYTYTIDLTKQESELNDNVSSKTRNLIKKAAKDGLTVELTSDYTFIEEIVKKSMGRNKVDLDYAFLKKILFTFANPSNSFSFVVKQEGKIISSTFCIFDDHSCYYLLGGYDQEHAHAGAGPLAVWNSILEAKKRGLKIFDFEGSMLPAIESYFRSFGGDLTPYYTINKGTLVTETLLKFKKRGQF